MSASPLLLPKPLSVLLGCLPNYPGAWLFVTGLNEVWAQQLGSDVTGMLQGKKLRLRVTDAGWTLDFSWQSYRFVACHCHDTADLTISACAHDLSLLARRREDPDTLFFSRRLTMEGDTELGLLIKNTLDAIELPVLSLAQFHPAAVLSRWRARVSTGRPGS